MAVEFNQDIVSTMKVEVYLNSKGYVLEEGESVSGKKSVTFQGFASSISANEAVNDETSPAIHNGVSGLMWLFTGQDEGNFNKYVTRIMKEEIEEDE